MSRRCIRPVMESIFIMILLIPASIRADDIISFIQSNRTTLENIKAVDAKVVLYQKTIAPTLQKTNDSAEKAAWFVLAGFATSDYRHNCAEAIASFQEAHQLVQEMDLDGRRRLIAILENPEFIDFKVATRLPMGYNAYAVKRLEQGGAAADVIIRQLKGWTDYYSAILELLFELSQPLDKCGVCETCLDCPLYKFKVTFYNFKALLNQDEFYTQLVFIKQAAIRAQDLGRAIESRYDLQ
ncbi:MAG: hypothetical protein K9N34_09090 [Candidatus Marinimicrobia bacterium]|nr:hypothetical protein [Candidatus Neomarinimicrobiota bacterium]MCF7903190.1 hypothetical protein [Candidatus Neomarinimicrobiota bacterium]